jgi:hypothetical protein
MTLSGTPFRIIFFLATSGMLGVSLAVVILSGPKPLRGPRKWLATAIEAGAGTLSIGVVLGWPAPWSPSLFGMLAVAWAANVTAAVILGWRDDRRLFGRLAAAAHVLAVAWLVSEFVYFLCCDLQD